MGGPRIFQWPSQLIKGRNHQFFTMTRKLFTTKWQTWWSRVYQLALFPFCCDEIKENDCCFPYYGNVALGSYYFLGL